MLEKNFCIGSVVIEIHSIHPIGYQWKSLCLDSKKTVNSKGYNSYEDCMVDARLHGLKQLIKKLDKPAAIINLYSDEILSVNLPAIEIFKISNPVGLNDSQFWENKQDALDYKRELISHGRGEKELTLLSMDGGKIVGMSNDLLFSLGNAIVSIATLSLG